MRNTCAVGIALVALALCGYGRAATVINFDPAPGDLPSALTAMGNSPGSAVPSNAQLSNQYINDGVLFSSSAPYVAVVNNGGTVATPPNAIGGATSAGLLSYADPVMFTFVVPGSTTPGVTASFSIQADSQGIVGQFATVTAFDVNGTAIDTLTLADSGSEVWSINLPGIRAVTFDFPTTSAGAPTTGTAFGSGTGIALDNLTFGPVSAAGTGGGGTPAVPLPPMAWPALLVIAGTLLVQCVRSRGALTRPCGGNLG